METLEEIAKFRSDEFHELKFLDLQFNKKLILVVFL